MPEVMAIIRIRDAERFRLFLWELQQIADKMRVEACPHASALARAVDRFVDGGDDDRPEESER